MHTFAQNWAMRLPKIFYSVADNQKKTPETEKCHNDTKYGVDVVDQMARKYTVRTMTRRWPIHSFQSTLDLAATNAWILYKEINGIKISRRRFLQNLSEDHTLPMAKSSTLTRTTEDIAAFSEQPPTRNCQVKDNCKKNRSVGRCYKCEKSLCGKCTARTQCVCYSCN